MSKGRWRYGQTSETTDEFRQCAECGAWYYWGDEQDHLEHAHGITADAEETFDPLHIRVARLKALIARTHDRRLRYELRKGLIQLESQLVASTLVLRTGAINGLQRVSNEIGTTRR
jgi:hypothetical protein